MKKIIIALVLCAIQSFVLARGGGFGAGFAGGMVGGMVGGAMTRPRSSQAPTVIVRESPQPVTPQQQIVKVVKEVVCIDEDGYEIPCPKRHRPNNRHSQDLRNRK